MPKPPIIIGIAGGSASGKSTLAKKLAEILPESAALLGLDSYYKDLLDHPGYSPERALSTYNVDHPESIDDELFCHHIENLIEGQSIDLPRYDYISMRRQPSIQKMKTASFIIVEGLFTLHFENLRPLLHHKFFVQSSEQNRKARRLVRDQIRLRQTEEQISTQLHKQVFPMHDLFVEPSSLHADVIVTNDYTDLKPLDELAENLLQHLIKR